MTNQKKTENRPPKKKKKKEIFEILDDVNQIAELEEKAEFKEYYDDKEEIRFAYPKNWFVQESHWAGDVKSVIINSPEGYFWLLAIFPKGTDPDEAAKEVLHTMKGEYDKLEDLPARRMIAGRRLTGYEMNFFYLDLVNTAVVLGFEENDRTFVIYWQNCDRLVISDEPYDFEDIFETITYTLLTHLDETMEKKNRTPGGESGPSDE